MSTRHWVGGFTAQPSGVSLQSVADLDFNPALLKLAREAQGLTQSELARRSDIGQGTISKYEKGLTRPSVEQVVAIAEALDFPPAFFADREARPATVLYRSRTLRSAKLEAHVRARLNLARLVSQKLLTDVAIDLVARFPEPDQTFPSPDAAAIELRRAWSIPDGPIENVTELLELAGGIVVRAELPTDQVVAAYMHPLDDPNRWFFVNASVHAGDRIRFSLAHELGHAVLHESALTPDTRLAETESNLFAGAFLLPAAEFRRALPRGRLQLEHLVELKRVWRVSIQTLLMRARQIEAITAADLTRLYKELSYRGWRASEPVHVEPEPPTVLPAVMRVHRDEHGLTDQDLTEWSCVSREVAHDLLPDLFEAPRGRGLRVVSTADLRQHDHRRRPA
jgi:Zn-dependent peptidase ImmA (M78 family)/DNA-binding XRE family transcriptional regulator